MGFYCVLERPTRSTHGDGAEGPVEPVDDYESLVMDACSLLEETDCRFHVEGFGSPDWRLDVGYDLSAFIEQLPGLLVAIRMRMTTEIDLYPPGVERTLDFRPTGDYVEIHCVSRTNWTPNPSIEIMKHDKLEKMFFMLAFDFATSLKLINSSIANCEPFTSWASNVV